MAERKSPTNRQENKGKIISLSAFKKEKDTSERDLRAAQADLNRGYIEEITTPEGLLIPPPDPNFRPRAPRSRATKAE